MGTLWGILCACRSSTAWHCAVPTITGLMTSPTEWPAGASSNSTGASTSFRDVKSLLLAPRRVTKQGGLQAKWTAYLSDFDAPIYMRKPFIKEFYRPELTFTHAVRSILRLHNETINIWSHLLGAPPTACSCLFAAQLDYRTTANHSNPVTFTPDICSYIR